jgi:cytosine/adenosine deaminase-related metal-dependent hydrolase
VHLWEWNRERSSSYRRDWYSSMPGESHQETLNRSHSNDEKGKLVKSAETNPAVGMSDARDKDVSSMSISSAVAAYEKFNGSFNDRLHIWMACGTPRGSPIKAHSDIGEAAKARNMGITMHCAEAPKDLEIFRGQYDCSPMQFCRDAQIAGPKTVLAHMVHPDPRAGDFEIMKETKTTISHNPTSNCKLGSGISPIPDMLEAGVNVSLGTDGAPCNNTYDMFREMHLAAILHSGVRESAGIITAYNVLEMATINGARALGLEKTIGSLEVGKKADFVVVNPGLYSAPWDSTEALSGGIDPVTVLVHSCTGADVEMVVVDGETLIEGGNLVLIDEQDVVQRAKIAGAGIRARSKVTSRNHMGLSYR